MGCLLKLIGLYFKVKARKRRAQKKICCYLQLRKLEKDIAVTLNYLNMIVKSEA